MNFSELKLERTNVTELTTKESDETNGGNGYTSSYYYKVAPELNIENGRTVRRRR